MRKITSIILALTFVIVSASGVQMAVMPRPQNVSQASISTNTADNNSPAVKRETPLYPKKAHEWAGYLFIGAGLAHVVLNKRPMLYYLKLRKSTNC
ncbi:MAG TPA: DUF4405 domain-containing protein [Patescibacteria group bacterium]|nr:DUF4405 domain-containing protein [Patescibacteria group bacterium]